MKKQNGLFVAMAVVAALTLVACEKKEERGVSRIPELTQQQQDDASTIPADSIHQAPPLSAVAPHGMGADMPTSGSAMGNSGMVVQAGATKVMAGGNILQVAGLAFTVSDSWQNVKPKNPVRVAEYELPGKAGKAEMAVYYFGKDQGGGIEDNVKRWAAQFASESTTGTDAQVARMEHDNLKIALVKTHGTYNPGSMGPMGPKAEPKADYALFGLVVAGGPEGSVFIKVTGPKTTIEEQNEDLEKMAQSVRVSDYK